MSAAIELPIKDRDFGQVTHGEARDQPEVREGQETLDAVTDTLTDRDRRHGVIRQDITGRNVMLLISGIHQPASPIVAAQTT